jgi:hypothetical protein
MGAEVMPALPMHLKLEMMFMIFAPKVKNCFGWDSL